MKLSQYIDEAKLAEYVHDGLVEVRHHKTLQLRIYTHTKKAVLEDFWDEVTTKCRGLVVHYPSGEIVARPFEKFFNINTMWRPDTLLSNLPLTKPEITEKLDGSLGIYYNWEGKSGIATKGSFYSDQAVWATEHYNEYHYHSHWPQGWTPLFEIIAESVQHHVVHYGGLEQLVLITLVNNDTGEEMTWKEVASLALQNGFTVVDEYPKKSLGDVINEDRKNREGYVLSWPVAGKPPLKIKVKHESFLALQKIVHAATPKAILEALSSKNVDVLNTWIGQTNDQLGMWVKEWVTKFNFRYANILLKCKLTTNTALSKCETRKEFAEYVNAEASKFDFVYPSVCFAMLDDRDHQRIIWKFVEQGFADELSKVFALMDLENAA